MKAPLGPKISQEDLKAILDTNPFPFLEECGRDYGKIFTLDLGTFGNREVEANGIWHFIWGSEYNKRLAALKYPKVDAGPARLVIGRRTLPGSSLFFNDGDIASTLRTIIATNFSDSQDTLIMAALALEESIQKIIDQHPDGNETSTGDFLRSIFTRSVFKVMFGESEIPHRTVGDKTANHSTLQQLLLASSSIPESAPASRQQNVRILNLLKAEIAERKKLFAKDGAPEIPVNHLDTLISLQLSGQPINDEAIADNLATNFYKCRVIYTILNQWAIHWLHINSQSKQKLLQELTTSFEVDNAESRQHKSRPLTPLTAVAINPENRPYLKAVSQELLRIIPYRVYQSARYVKEEISFDGYGILPGSMIASLEYLTHHDPETYPEPHTFSPERFLEQGPRPFEWTPFGMGERDCPFKDAALSLLSMSVAGIQTYFDIEPQTANPLPDNSIGVLPFTQLGANNFIRWQPRKFG